jgi:peptidoglycan/xylan/chitin deacetylase (PgdA/CDA1 family)
VVVSHLRTQLLLALAAACAAAAPAAMPVAPAPTHMRRTARRTRAATAAVVAVAALLACCSCARAAGAPLPAPDAARDAGAASALAHAPTVVDDGVASPFWSCASLDRGVALSYDDGPSEHTERLLDYLAAGNATATFFVLSGAATSRTATVRRALAEGHAVGLHTAQHANLSALWAAGDWAGLRREIDDAADALTAVTGTRPRYFRPPYGALTPGVRDYLHARGFALALWSAGCVDWAVHDASREIPLYVNGMPDAGGVLCLHDTHASTVDATPALLAALRAGPEGGWVNPQGRELISLDRCTGRRAGAGAGAAVGTAAASMPLPAGARFAAATA